MSTDSAEWRTRRAILDAIGEGPGFSQAFIAVRLGLSQKHVSQVLTGKAGLSFDLAERMLAAMGRQLEIIVTEQTAAARIEMWIETYMPDIKLSDWQRELIRREFDKPATPTTTEQGADRG